MSFGRRSASAKRALLAGVALVVLAGGAYDAQAQEAPRVAAPSPDGLAEGELGLRLRYEIRREFAPYVGVVRKYRCGFDEHGPGFEPVSRSETQIVAGLRLWF